MCIDCYTSCGSPTVVNGNVKKAVELIRAVYEYAPTGGMGHIVFDDWNIEDHDIEWCIENGGINSNEDTGEQTNTSIRALRHFLTLSEDERASALAIFEGCYGMVSQNTYD